MYWGLPGGFLLLLAAALAHPATSVVSAYVFTTLAALLATGVLLWRASIEREASRAWLLCALSCALWAFGEGGNLWQELVRGRLNEMYRLSMLGFTLASVPLTFLLATEWRLRTDRIVRVLDALTALALGGAFCLFTLSAISEHASAASERGVASLVWLVDAQNAYIAAAAWLRCQLARGQAEWHVFRALKWYAASYALLVAINDHFIAGDPAYGPQYQVIVIPAFLALVAFGLYGGARRPPVRVSEGFARAGASASPILLSVALLVVSLFMIPLSYPWGCAGVVAAVIGYGLRSALTHAHELQRADLLRGIAWTDGLTGVPNRHFIDQWLRRAWRATAPRRPHAIFMIDIDHFKQLNDRYGHGAGDECLRVVAHQLRQCLLGDDAVLARYGGEEFVALMRDCDAARAVALGERLRTHIECLRIENRDTPVGTVTVSVGAATGELGDAHAAARLLEQADRALYEAKCAGRNRLRLLGAAVG